MKTKIRIYFGRAAVDVITKKEVLACANEFLSRKSQSAAVIATVNAQFVHLAGQEPRFAKYLERADLSIADGMSLVFGSRILGQPLPERITGVDLSVDLCALLDQQGGSVYLLGGKPSAAQAMAAKLQNIYPNVQIAGIDCPPMDFEKMLEKATSVLQKIQVAHPDLLLVGFGAPKQEYWIENNLLSLPCKLVMGVGGTFDMLSGQVSRAPHWMQKSGMEWFYRLCHDPKRLWRRYLFGNIFFSCIIVKQLFRQALCRNK